MAKKTTKIFDATLQKEVDHELVVDQNGEIVATSVESGHSIKFPAGLTRGQFDKAVAAHRKNNEGQEVIDPKDVAEHEAKVAKSEELLDSF